MPRVGRKPGLSKRQMKFAREYLVDLNFTQAAIRAGYSKKTAGSQGHRLMKNVEIAALVEKGREKAEQNAEVTFERIVQEYKRLALLDPAEMFDVDGNLLQIHEMPEDARRAISGFDSARIEGGKKLKATEIIRKVRLADKRAALDSLSKQLGYEKPTEHNVTVSYGDILDKVWSDKGRPAPVGSTRKG